jgi:chromosomal replication initiation ATPase DnaA
MNLNEEEYIEGIEDVIFHPIFKVIDIALKDTIGYNSNTLKIKSNAQALVYPRIIFSYLCRKENVPLRVIGKKIGKDHSTVSGYLVKFETYYENEKVFKLIADAVINKYKEIKDGK